MTEVQEEPRVIQNSDFLYRTPNEWVQDIEYKEPNEYEKKILEGTLDAKTLLEAESNEEPIFLTDEEILKRERKDYITRVKVIALRGCQRPILTNPTFLKQVEKNKIIKAMQHVIDTFTPEEIIEKFNEICGEEIFTGEGDDYKNYPINRC
jgi:hypothetical protein